MNGPTETRKPVGGWRIAGAGLSLVLAGLTVWLATVSSRGRRAFAEVGAAEPVRMSVDLSRPGEVEAPFHNTHRSIHGVVLWASGEAVEAGPESDAGSSPFAGLRGEVVIQDADGVEVARDAIEPDRFFRGSRGWALTTVTQPADVGYRMMLRIDDGASGLEDGRVEVVGRYRLCGCEAMPAAFAGLLAGVMGIVALVVGLPSWAMVLWAGWRGT